MITPTEATVWIIDLDRTATATPDWNQLLPDSEIAAAGRFLGHTLQSRFLARRAARRQILGRILGIGPRNLHFCLASEGKPALAPPLSNKLQFNASSSGRFAAVIAAKHGELGIDLQEHSTPPAELDALLPMLAPEESLELGQVQPSRRQVAFHDLWACKEALLKATGRGLLSPPSSTAIELTPTPRVLRVDGIASGAIPWQIRLLTCPQGWSLAVAIPHGMGIRIQQHQA
jgi:4'-phosphopantetheinyl transferase